MNQEAIDLFIPVFLKGKQKCWEKNPIVPLFGERPGKLKWKLEHLAKVRDTFTGILVQVRNNQAGDDTKERESHEKMQKIANQIFGCKKQCINLYMQIAEKNAKDKRPKPDVAVSNAAGSLNISIYGLNRYRKANERFNEQEMEQLMALSMFCSELRYDVNEKFCHYSNRSAFDYSQMTERWWNLQDESLKDELTKDETSEDVPMEDVPSED